MTIISVREQFCSEKLSKEISAQYPNDIKFYSYYKGVYIPLIQLKIYHAPNPLKCKGKYTALILILE